MQNNAEVKAALATANSARTDLEKRKLLRVYYEMLYAKMTALAAPEMKTYLNDKKNEALNALPQPRVRPDASPSPTKAP
ncbi:MAG: hypothetical protein ABR589_09880 [Chthoniobacterales bacterium]